MPSFVFGCSLTIGFMLCSAVILHPREKKIPVEKSLGADLHGKIHFLRNL